MRSRRKCKRFSFRLFAATGAKVSKPERQNASVIMPYDNGIARGLRPTDRSRTMVRGTGGVRTAVVCTGCVAAGVTQRWSQSNLWIRFHVRSGVAGG